MGNKFGVGPREQVIINILSTGAICATIDLIMAAAEQEIASRGMSSGDAESYLRCEGSTYHCFWRMDTHEVIRRLINRGLVERVEKGYYVITKEGLTHATGFEEAVVGTYTRR